MCSIPNEEAICAGFAATGASGSRGYHGTGKSTPASRSRRGSLAAFRTISTPTHRIDLIGATRRVQTGAVTNREG